MGFKFFVKLLCALLFFQAKAQLEADSLSKTPRLRHTSGRRLQTPHQARRAPKSRHATLSRYSADQSGSALELLKAVHAIFPKNSGKRKLAGSAGFKNFDDTENSNVITAEEQKRLLLLQFYEVIYEAREDGSVMDPRIARLLTSYLQHLEYVFMKRDKHQELPPPALYEYQTDKEILSYKDSPLLSLPDEAFLDEEEDDYVELFDEFNSDNLMIIKNVDEVKSQKTNKLDLDSAKKTGRKARDNNENYFQLSKKIPLDPIYDDQPSYNEKKVLNEHEIEDFKQMVYFYVKEFDKIFDEMNHMKPVGRVSQSAYLMGSVNLIEVRNAQVENTQILRQIAIGTLMNLSHFTKVLDELVNKIATVPKNMPGIMVFYEYNDLLGSLEYRQSRTRNRRFDETTLSKMKCQEVIRRMAVITFFAKNIKEAFEDFRLETKIIRSAEFSHMDINSPDFPIVDPKATAKRYKYYQRYLSQRLNQIYRELEGIQQTRQDVYGQLTGLENAMDEAIHGGRELRQAGASEPILLAEESKSVF